MHCVNDAPARGWKRSSVNCGESWFKDSERMKDEVQISFACSRATLEVYFGRTMAAVQHTLATYDDWDSKKLQFVAG